MATTERPIRLTKQRFQALHTVIVRGLDEMKASLQDNYGIDFDYVTDEQTADEAAEDFQLIDPSERETVNEIVATIQAAEAAFEIITRRYGA